MKKILIAVLLIAVLIAATGCAASPNEMASRDEGKAGFWLGLWHGFILPFTFIISLFSDKVGIYEINNTGNWYNFGFMFGVSIIFGGGGGGAGSRACSRSKG